MIDRRALLADLISLRRPLAGILDDLKRTRPAPRDLLSLTRHDLSAILRRVRSGDLSFTEATMWAKEVELTDDIGREDGWQEALNGLLFEMASPELDNRSEEQRLKEWRGRLVGLDVAGRDGNAAAKHPSIARLIQALDLPSRGWTAVAHWDGDTCAVGVARTGAFRRLVYVSVWNLPPGRYYYECEAPTGSDPADYRVVERGEDVDFETLLRAMDRHLGKRQ